MELCLFDPEGDETRHVLEAGPDGVHRGIAREATAGQAYGLRTHGPWIPEQGVWHHPALLLLDPFARAVSGRFTDHPSVHHHGPREDTAPFVPKGILVSDPIPPRPGPSIPWSDTVIYETHVRGLTMLHPEVEPDLRGTYLGTSSPPVLEHLRQLGVTTVELMPVAHHVPEPFLQARGLTNYWGYSTLAWFAPHGGYASGEDGRQVAEFARMVDEFHAAGLEVIVDVVFNHTVEGNVAGPILSMKGLDNSGWYRLGDRAEYVDWTGTGNTINTEDPRVRAAIVEALRWWSEGLGVDGFRFDLGVTLGRGRADFDPQKLEWLTSDPVLSGRKLIAEPWDLGPHGYRLGGFGGEWREWNDRFRDDVRDFWTARTGRYTLASRIGGSPDVFGDRGPLASVNFVTAHDGFTLRDLVSYDHKHNEANGEANGDGHGDNRSWNSGVEGPTDDANVLEIRRRRAGAHLVTLLLSAGIPMILGGDELGRTQHGNNNSYPLNSELNWYDWTERPFADLISRAIACRRRHPGLTAGTYPEVRLAEDPEERAVLEIDGGGDRIVIVANNRDAPIVVPLPPGSWRLDLDSSQPDAGEIHLGDTHVPAWTIRIYREIG